MKNLALLGALLFQTHALADTKIFNRVLKDTTTDVALVLDNKSVFCTARGYGTSSLKISVPDLNWLTHFDHRVEGEGIPCMTAGSCEDIGPDKILSGNERVNIVPIKVVLNESLEIDSEKKTCTQQLFEEIHSIVRGIQFSHNRSSGETSIDFEKCVKLTSTLKSTP